MDITLTLISYKLSLRKIRRIRTFSMMKKAPHGSSFLVLKTFVARQECLWEGNFDSSIIFFMLQILISLLFHNSVDSKIMQAHIRTTHLPYYVRISINQNQWFNSILKWSNLKLNLIFADVHYWKLHTYYHQVRSRFHPYVGKRLNFVK